MNAQRRSGGGFHGFVEAIRRFVEAVKRAKNGGPSGGGRPAGGPGGARGRRWERCPACGLAVPALCVAAEEGAEPCGLGLECCCGGPHFAPKNAKGGDRGTGDGGKFQTSAERA